jgi:hypothetical protein
MSLCLASSGAIQTQVQVHGHLSELAWVFHLYFVMFPASTSLVGSFHLPNYPLPLKVFQTGATVYSSGHCSNYFL